MDYSQGCLSLGHHPQATLLTIGSELLCGSVLNSNAQYLGRELTQLGFQVRAQWAVPDEEAAIHGALRSALNSSEVILITGGLGPTPDDITRDSLASFFRVPLVFSKRQYDQIVKYYRRRKKAVPAIVRREAYFPANARPIFNRFGIALGFVIDTGKQVILVVPGVPGEMTRLYEQELVPLLGKRFPRLRRFFCLTVKTIGLSEPSIMQRLGKSFFKLGEFKFGIYPEAGEASLRLYSDSAVTIRRLRTKAVRELPNNIYSFEAEPIEAVIGRCLKARGATVALAESCTGGRVSKLLTSVPGASRYFKGAVIVYHNQTKIDLLQISKADLESKGAVSDKVAVEMASKIRLRLKSTVGLSVTGVAGPAGGSFKKPVGLVYIALCSAERKTVWRETFWGDREQIQEKATKKALEHLWRWARK